MIPMMAVFLSLLPTTWIVDASNGPGANFTDLPPAVAAASGGDTILVRAGYYTPFSVTGKALTIRGAGASVTIVSIPVPVGPLYGETRIANVPAGGTFYVSGIAFTPSLPPAPPPYFPPVTPPLAGLIISGAATQVVLADVTVQGILVAVNFNEYSTPGLSVTGGAEVHASRCTLAGGSGGSTAAPAGWGAGIGIGCKLAADASTFGGGGGSFTSPGAHGLSVAGVATLSRCSAFGTAGFSGSGSGIFVASSGFARVTGIAPNVVQGGGCAGFWTCPSGFAILASPGSSAVVHGTVSLVSAVPGAPVTSGSVVTGAAGLPYVSLGGTVNAAGELAASQPVTVVVDGLLALAPFALAVDVAPSFSSAFGPIVLGEVLVPVRPAAILQGNLDAAGMFQATATPAAAAPSLVGIPVYLQAGVLDAVAGQIRLSNGYVRIFQ